MTIRVGVLTVSDRCSRNEVVDKSGPAIVEVLASPAFRVVHQEIVPDDVASISTVLKHWSDDVECDVILSTGGTGFAARDVTPEATLKVIDKIAQNISMYLLIESLRVTPFAALGRGVAGIRNHCLIVNLPGSPQGARDQASLLVPLLPHAIAVLRGQAFSHPVE